MGRKASYSSDGLTKGAWNAHEDKLLISCIKIHGEGKWRSIPQKAGLKRCGKSCRLRWLNYLRPNIKHGNFSEEEEDLIIRLHKLLGNRWSLIAGRIPGRTDNEIKNYWNTTLSKKVGNQQSKMAVEEATTTSSSSPPKKEETAGPIRPKAFNYTRSYLSSFQKLFPSPPRDDEAVKAVEENNNNYADFEDWCFDIGLEYMNDEMMFSELDLDVWI